MDPRKRLLQINSANLPSPTSSAPTLSPTNNNAFPQQQQQQQQQPTTTTSSIHAASPILQNGDDPNLEPPSKRGNFSSAEFASATSTATKKFDDVDQNRNSFENEKLVLLQKNTQIQELKREVLNCKEDRSKINSAILTASKILENVSRLGLQWGIRSIQIYLFIYPRCNKSFKMICVL